MRGRFGVSAGRRMILTLSLAGLLLAVPGGAQEPTKKQDEPAKPKASSEAEAHPANAAQEKKAPQESSQSGETPTYGGSSGTVLQGEARDEKEQQGRPEEAPEEGAPEVPSLLARPGGAPVVPAARQGENIESIQWTGLRTLSQETMAFYLGLKVGSPFDPARLNDNLHKLWERNLIDDIVIDEEPGEHGGVRLTVNVSERPVLRSVVYEGLKKLSRTEIQDKIDKEHIQVREGLPLQRGELQRLESQLEEMYREKGYRFAEVTYALEEVSPGEVTVKFTGDEGDKVKIGKVNFSGNTVFSDFRLRIAMHKTKGTGLISRILKHDVYNPANYQEDIDRVKKLYHEKGYKNVVVGDPELTVKARHPRAASAKKQKRRLFITIPVDEGHRWKFGEISIEGNKVYSDEMLLRAFNRPRGPWLRSTAIDKGVEAITAAYRNTGYIYSQVTTELKERDNDVADVIVHVVEGDQYRVGRLEFQGNDRTLDKVLRREFRVQEARVVNMGALKNSLYKLNQLGYFKLDQDNPIEFQNFDSEKKTVDLLVHGEEADRTELLFGGGWSELDGLFGQFSVRTQNFRGRGETLSVALQNGGVTDRYEVSYFVPWLRDRPQSAGFQLFKRSYDYVLYGNERELRDETGGVLTFGRSFGLFQSASISYGYSDLRDTIQYTDTTGVSQSNTTLYRKSNIRPSWSYQSIDNRLEPTRGLRAVFSLEYSGGFLGGNIDLWRPEATFTYYHPMSRSPVRTVLGFNLQSGWIEPFGSEPLPVLERYYLGGSRSVRGFATRSIYLRDSDGNPIQDANFNILGGTSYLQASLEYHLLLGGPFRLVLFADAGNVFDSDYGRPFSVTDLRYSAGVELRLFVPVFGLPLRFIYAKNLSPLPGDRFESFQFDVGPSF